MFKLLYFPQNAYWDESKNISLLINDQTQWDIRPNVRGKDKHRPLAFEMSMGNCNIGTCQKDFPELFEYL